MKNPRWSGLRHRLSGLLMSTVILTGGSAAMVVAAESPASADVCGAYTVRSASATAYRSSARVTVEVRSNCDKNWVRAASNTRQYVVVTYDIAGMGSRRYEGYTNYDPACGPNGPYCTYFAVHGLYPGSGSGYIYNARVWSATVGYTPYV